MLVSNYLEYHRLAAYLRRHTERPIALAMGIPAIGGLFDETIYEDLEGGVLEAFGRLFRGDLRLYVYPTRDAATGALVTTDTFEVAPHLRHLYAHLLDNDCLEQIDGYDESYLDIFSHDVLARIRARDAAWEAMVPDDVRALIKERELFGYRADADG